MRPPTPTAQSDVNARGVENAVALRNRLVADADAARTGVTQADQNATATRPGEYFISSPNPLPGKPGAPAPAPRVITNMADRVGSPMRVAPGSNEMVPPNERMPGDRGVQDRGLIQRQGAPASAPLPGQTPEQFAVMQRAMAPIMRPQSDASKAMLARADFDRNTRRGSTRREVQEGRQFALAQGQQGVMAAAAGAKPVKDQFNVVDIPIVGEDGTIMKDDKERVQTEQVVYKNGKLETSEGAQLDPIAERNAIEGLLEKARTDAGFWKSKEEKARIAGLVKRLDNLTVQMEAGRGAGAEYTQDNPATPKSPAEAAALPKGSFYRMPDGTIRQV